MWTFYKIINFIWLLTSTWLWVTTYVPMLPMLILVNVMMVFCLTLLPIKIEFTKKTGFIILAITAMTLWQCICSGVVVAGYTLLCYLPALYLTFLPVSSIRSLLEFSTRWLAILLIPALLIYWALFFVDLPSFGKFVHPVYVPFDNYIFYLQTTWDNGVVTRFNAFLLEPGHLALLCSFLLIANRFRFKECKWLIILTISIIFSFSLAGYLLAFVGFILLKVDSILKALAIIAFTAVLVIGVQTFTGEESSINKLILERLERDESQGIKGNNRFAGDTDFVYDKALKSGDVWTGLSDRVNMDMILGAGYKIYVIQYGFIGALLALFIYLTLIPPHPDYRFTAAFLIVLILCFIQRSYPGWYSWLFPYVAGLWVESAAKSKDK